MKLFGKKDLGTHNIGHPIESTIERYEQHLESNSACWKSQSSAILYINSICPGIQIAFTAIIIQAL